MINIIIVEDNAIIGLDMQRQVEKAGYNVIANLQTYEEAKKVIKKTQDLDVILMDINLGENSKDGIELVKEINIKNNIAIVYITGEHAFDTHMRALETRPISYISKPFKPRVLIEAINIAFEKKL